MTTLLVGVALFFISAAAGLAIVYLAMALFSATNLAAYRYGDKTIISPVTAQYGMLAGILLAIVMVVAAVE